MSRTENVSRNLYWGILNKFIALGLPFLTRTVMIYTLGMDYVGLGSLFSSILNVLSFAELGIGSALVFSMYKPMAEKNDSKVCALLNLYRITYRIIGIIILIIGLVLIPFLDNLVAGDLPVGINLRILFLIYLCNNLLGYFLFAYKQSLFTASQRVDVISKVNMFLQLISGSIQIFILLFLRNYYIYISVIPFITILNNVIVAHLANKEFPQYQCSGLVDKIEITEIKRKVGGMLFQKIGTIILTSADTIVISSFLGLKILGVYNGYYYIISSLFGFLQVIEQALIPSIGNSIVSETVDKNLSDFKRFQFMYMWIVIWWSSCLLTLIQPFVKLWQGQQNMLSDSIVILMVIYFFVHTMGNINALYREAIGLWWETRFVPVISSFVNLFLNIILVQKIGLYGIILSTVFAIVFINFPFGSKVTFSHYFKSIKEWHSYMVRTGLYFITMLIISYVTWKVCILIPGQGFGNLILRGIVCAILPNILLIVFNFKNPEFKPAGQFVMRMLPNRFVPAVVRRFFS